MNETCEVESHKEIIKFQHFIIDENLTFYIFPGHGALS